MKYLLLIFILWSALFSDSFLNEFKSLPEFENTLLKTNITSYNENVLIEYIVDLEENLYVEKFLSSEDKLKNSLKKIICKNKEQKEFQGIFIFYVYNIYNKLILSFDLTHSVKGFNNTNCN